MSHSFAKNIPVYAIGELIPKAAAFFLLPLYARYMSVGEYGIVGSMQTISWFLTIVFTLSFDRSINRLYFDYKSPEEKKDFLGTIFLSILIFSTTMLICTFVFHTYVSKVFSTIPFYPFYVYAFLTAYLYGIQALPLAHLMAKQQAKAFVLLSLTQFILNAGLSIWFVVASKNGAEGMLKAGLLAIIILTPYYLYYSIKESSFKINIKYLKTIALFSLPLVPNLISAWVLNLSSRIFIDKYLSLTDVGIYSMATKISEIYILFAASFSKAYAPAFFEIGSSNDQQSAVKKLFRCNRGYINISIFVLFTFALLSKELIDVLLDARYAGTYKVVDLILISYLFSTILSIASLSIYQAKKTVVIMYVFLFGAAVNIGLNIVLIPAFGIYGAAYSLVLSNVFSAIIAQYYAQKQYPVPLQWLKTVGLFICLIGVVVIIVFMLKLPIVISLLIKFVLITLLGWYVYSQDKEMFLNMVYLKAKN